MIILSEKLQLTTVFFFISVNVGYFIVTVRVTRGFQEEFLFLLFHPPSQKLGDLAHPGVAGGGDVLRFLLESLDENLI